MPLIIRNTLWTIFTTPFSNQNVINVYIQSKSINQATTSSFFTYRDLSYSLYPFRVYFSYSRGRLLKNAAAAPPPLPSGIV